MMWLSTAAAVVFGLSVYGWFIEPRRFRTRTLRVELAGPNVRPLKLLHLSDFHFFKGQTHRRDALHRLAQNQYDLIFITGDMIDDDSGIDLCVEALKPFQAKYGVYAVMGNHDYVLFRGDDFIPGFSNKNTWKYNDADRLIAGLQSIGVKVLVNERVDIEVDGERIIIAGLDDPFLKRADVAKTFDGYDASLPCLALAHAPEVYDQIAATGADMAFCGHTHGGQICAPFWGPIVTRTQAPRAFAAGLTRLNGMTHFTTNGFGSSRVTRPRFLCPPEAVVFEICFVRNGA
ncbi:MAG: metallophosphoesterase [Candidatus Hinthialibacter antarcticus]|nr:metallophosphoesterase [Candidatus Hinthialibacter antarcticus]